MKTIFPTTTFQKKWRPYITYSILLITVLLFFIESFTGDSNDSETALRFGAMLTPLALEQAQCYRLLTAIFIHFGLEHLASNMLSLFFLGPYIEAIFGRAGILILYLFSGIAGNLCTMAVELSDGHFAVSAGASGAIYGLLGAIIALALQQRYRKIFPLQRVIIGVGLSLFGGFTIQNVNVSSHIGGLLGGFFLAFIMSYLHIRRLQTSSDSRK